MEIRSVSVRVGGSVKNNDSQSSEEEDSEPEAQVFSELKKKK